MHLFYVFLSSSITIKIWFWKLSFYYSLNPQYPDKIIQKPRQPRKHRIYFYKSYSAEKYLIIWLRFYDSFTLDTRIIK